MLRYLIRRLCESAIVLALMSFVIYGLLGLMPGDPIDLMASGDPNITSEDVARLKAVYGLDRPLLERYGHWPSSARARSSIATMVTGALWRGRGKPRW
jgi:peptide/nickel transport system permease protein